MSSSGVPNPLAITSALAEYAALPCGPTVCDGHSAAVRGYPDDLFAEYVRRAGSPPRGGTATPRTPLDRSRTPRDGPARTCSSRRTGEKTRAERASWNTVSGSGWNRSKHSRPMMPVHSLSPILCRQSNTRTSRPRLGQAQRRHIARGTCSRHDHVMHTRVLRLGRTYFEVHGPLIVPKLPALADSLPRGILTCAGPRTTLDPAPSGAVPNALTLRGRAPTLLRA